MPSRANKIQRLEDRVKFLSDNSQKLSLRQKELSQEMTLVLSKSKQLVELFAHLNPIIGRLIAAYIVLEKKGLITDAEINEINQNEGDFFVKKVIPTAPEQVQNQPERTGPVEGDSGNIGAGVSGAESVREPAPRSKADEQSIKGTELDGLPGVRTSNGGDDKSIDTSPTTSESRPSGPVE